MRAAPASTVAGAPTPGRAHATALATTCRRPSRPRLHDPLEPRHPRRHADGQAARPRRPARAHDDVRQRAGAERRRHLGHPDRAERLRGQEPGRRARRRHVQRARRPSTSRAASSCAAPARTRRRARSSSAPTGGPVLAIGTMQDTACYDGSGFDATAKPLLTQDATKETATDRRRRAASGFSAGDLALVDQKDDSEVSEGDCTTIFKRSGQLRRQRARRDRRRSRATRSR